MSYQVLARKWRPRTFEQMVGQEHVLRMLMNALDNQRLHHAYLFTGTRGVGKTTLARLFAKCLNCETGITSHPCGTCKTCEAIDAGKFLDLIEVDAASRTKVEDTRELLDNVQYMPSQGRFKIYLIDEVHMLSGHSFNALLKTLEEPPAHVKFLLATTDPKRLPITILSRCLQFNLKRVPVEQIAAQLAHICTTEQITHDTDALALLAHAADGSLRDALSLLDQAIAYCGEKIALPETRQMLGTIEQDALFRLLDALANHDGATLINTIREFAEHAPNFSQALEEMLTILHQTSLTHVIDNTAAPESIKKLAAAFSPEETQLYYQIALIGRRDLPLAPSPQLGFEMIMLRMLAFRPTSPASDTKQVSPITVKKPETTKPVLAAETKTKVETKIEKTSPLTIPPTAESESWAVILSKLGLTGMTHAFAANCTLTRKEGATIELSVAAKHAAMLNTKLSERIEQALSTYFNNPIKLHIKIIAEDTIQTPAKQQHAEQAARHATATESITNDSHVKQIVDLFNATLDMSSIKAVD